MKQRQLTSLYLRYQDEILLLYRRDSRVHNHVWIASAGGHLESKELNDPTAGVLRELKEELGIDLGEIENLSLRYLTSRYTEDELRIQYMFFADMKEKYSLTSNKGDLSWFSLNQLPSLSMPKTAKEVLNHYREKGQFTTGLYQLALGQKKAKITLLTPQILK